MSTPTPPEHKTRDTITLRLPRWMIRWLDENTGMSRTFLIEFAIRKAFKLKEPK